MSQPCTPGISVAFFVRRLVEVGLKVLRGGMGRCFPRGLTVSDQLTHQD